ncbi:MAG: sulfur transferase domain-containing protein [Moraxella sp.]|nr:sulfur transferase domain-containing protein [Moraxella sp.]
MTDNIQDIAPEFRITVSGQITPADVAELAGMGVRTIINNRPDGEEAGQPTSDEIAAACVAHGIAYKQIAFSGGMMDMNHVQEFADFFNATHRPLHIFCRTGNRSSTILAAARERDMLDEE